MITSSWVFFELVPVRKARRESLTNSSIKDPSRAMLGLDNNSRLVNQTGCLCYGVITILIAWKPKMVTRMKSPHDVLPFNQRSFRARDGSKPMVWKIGCSSHHRHEPKGSQVVIARTHWMLIVFQMEFYVYINHRPSVNYNQKYFYCISGITFTSIKANQQTKHQVYYLIVSRLYQGSVFLHLKNVISNLGYFTSKVVNTSYEQWSCGCQDESVNVDFTAYVVNV